MNLSPKKDPGLFSLSAGKAAWTGFSLRLLVPPRNSWSKVPERPFAAAPTPCAGFSSTMPLVRAVAVGARWLCVAIVTKSPPS